MLVLSSTDRCHRHPPRPLDSRASPPVCPGFMPSPLGLGLSPHLEEVEEEGSDRELEALEERARQAEPRWEGLTNPRHGRRHRQRQRQQMLPLRLLLPLMDRSLIILAPIRHRRQLCLRLIRPSHRRPQSPNTSIDTMNDSTVSSISIDHGGGGGGGGGQQQQQGSQSLHRQTRSDGTGSSSLCGGRWLDEDDGEGGGGGRKSQQQHEQDEEIGRTRLDSSSLLSPEPKASREGGSKQKHGASAPSAAPAPFASFGRTSFGGEGGDAAIGHCIVDESGVPLTPGAATLGFQLDTNFMFEPVL